VIRETILFGKRWKAKEALEGGLVDAVVAKGALLTTAKQLVIPALNKDRGIIGLIKKDLYGEVARKLRGDSPAKL
jgi:enoyl-CoA hydratase/carnithine racemase